MKPLKRELHTHIIPLGTEIDRAVIPLREYNATKAVILCDRNPDGISEYFLNRIKKRIREECPNVKDVSVECWFDWRDLSSIIAKMSEVVRREQEAGSHTWINISSGSKLSAIAGTMVAMMYGSHAYYVVPEKYAKRVKRQATTGFADAIEIPRYSIEAPDDRLVYVLSVIDRYGRPSQKTLVRELTEKGLLRSKSEDGVGSLNDNAVYALFRRKFLVPLEEKGWVRREGRRRGATVVLTEDGRTQLETFKNSNKMIEKIEVNQNTLR